MQWRISGDNEGFVLLSSYTCGNKGNEAYDKAAKQACNPLNSPMPSSDLKLAITFFYKK